MTRCGRRVRRPRADLPRQKARRAGRAHSKLEAMWLRSRSPSPATSSNDRHRRSTPLTQPPARAEECDDLAVRDRRGARSATAQRGLRFERLPLTTAARLPTARSNRDRDRTSRDRSANHRTPVRAPDCRLQLEAVRCHRPPPAFCNGPGAPLVRLAGRLQRRFRAARDPHTRRAHPRSPSADAARGPVRPAQRPERSLQR